MKKNKKIIIFGLVLATILCVGIKVIQPNISLASNTFEVGFIDTDSALTSNSAHLVPSQSAVKTALALKATATTTLAGYGITDAYPLSSNPSGFLTSSTAVSYPHWVKITVPYTSFSTAGLTNTITIATLASSTVVSGTLENTTTPFTGGLIAGYTISVGMANTVDLMPASSAFATSTQPFSSNLIASAPTATSQTVTATAIATTGLLNTATAGSVNIWLLESTFP